MVQRRLSIYIKSITCICIVFALAACDGNALRVNQAWIQKPVAGSDTLAAYATVENNTAAAVTLEGISSDAFAAVMLHKSMIENGIASMKPVRILRLPAGAKVVMEPGGLHAMLIESARDLMQGDAVVLQFRFSNGVVLPVEFIVRNNFSE